MQQEDKDEHRVKLDSKNIMQRGVCGVFVGLPTNQAGWLICVPQSGRVFVSTDATFDENFGTFALAHNKVLCHNSLPVQGRGLTHVNNSRLQAFAGPPQALCQDQQEIPHMRDNEIKVIDTFELVSSSSLRDLPEGNDPKLQGESQQPDSNKIFAFANLLNHQGLLKRGDSDCNRSMCSIKVPASGIPLCLNFCLPMSGCVASHSVCSELQSNSIVSPLLKCSDLHH